MEVNGDAIHDDEDSSDHLTAYIYNSNSEARPAKRRREDDEVRGFTDSRHIQLDCQRNINGFPTLLNDNESQECVKLRFSTYETLWLDLEQRTNEVLEQVNEETLSQVSNFVQKATPELYNGRLPTALILAGPNIASHATLFSQVSHRIQEEDKIGSFVNLTSKDATNLKNVLKKIIAEVTGGETGKEDNDDDLVVNSRYLNYDLQILCNWCRNRSDKVIIAIQDTEAFDTAIMTDLIILLAQFIDRIPLILLLGIATSEEIFHDKLPKSTIRLIRGERFDVQRFEESMEQVFEEAITASRSLLKIGPNLCESLFVRLKEHTRSIQSFIASLKYAYMSHFYANPLTVIIGCLDDEEEMKKKLSDDHLEAIRNLPSFRRLVEYYVNEGRFEDVKLLLENDNALRSVVHEGMQTCLQYGTDIWKGLSIFQLLLNSINSSQKKDIQRYDLYSRILFGDFTESPLFRDVILSVKKLNSEGLQNLMTRFLSEISDVPELESIIAETLFKMKSLTNEKETSNSRNKTSNTSLISEFDITNDSMRTTVMSGRVRLDEFKKNLTKQDLEYSTLVKQLTDVLETYFYKTLKGVHNLFLNEIMFYDIESIHSAVFTPNTRPAIERALSNPQDYLASEFCEDVATQPITSIIYQLYLDAGTLINIFDLWSAFCSLVGAADMEDGEEKETLQALFYRGLAELKYLGMIKISKRKTDHLQKLAWKGL